ncbi:MBL fold metallo-hydrolase [Emticicia sp. 21SJ11W-3]|uniref:MBL fold metallo-hydrolase n=1 Tax=Emticicia sp. 21SJ11W-3 TaxID=2916755 RepID=UPI0020A1F6FA|nr:MBL fold metallo-hydrolase [Emticicia sp. 21SJ11W-3]UTA67624.1 MBL fold metallo-hydrolase [Emticicia sp. 21SJ11W-3]
MQYLKHRKFADVELFRFGYAPIGKPWFNVYCFVFDHVLIDTAQAHCREKVKATFKDKRIEKILLTHFHEDHSGNVAALAIEHKAEVFAHAATQEKIKKGFGLHPYEKVLFGHITPYESHIHHFPAIIETPNHQLVPIYTPGHSDDHTVFLEPNKGWLFSGDLFVGIRIRVFRKGEKFWQQVASMKNILQYNFDVLFCGHHPRLKDGKQQLQAKLQYFEDFGGHARGLHQKGLPVKDIMRTMKLRENHLMRLLLSNDVSVRYMVEAALEDE